jgi:hypothetical protein
MEKIQEKYRGDTVIELELSANHINQLFFDAVRDGRAQFAAQQEHLVGEVTEEEFDGFLKDNNLILYRNTLKSYENGEVVGEFRNL